MKEFVVSRDDTFIRTFVTRHKFTIKHSVYLESVTFLHHISHTIEHNFFRIFEKLARFDMLRILLLHQSIYDFRKLHLSPVI